MCSEANLVRNIASFYRLETSYVLERQKSQQKKGEGNGAGPLSYGKFKAIVGKGTLMKPKHSGINVRCE
jgi:hypothetical protein